MASTRIGPRRIGSRPVPVSHMSGRARPRTTVVSIRNGWRAVRCTSKRMFRSGGSGKEIAVLPGAVRFEDFSPPVKRSRTEKVFW